MIVCPWPQTDQRRIQQAAEKVDYAGKQHYCMMKDGRESLDDELKVFDDVGPRRYGADGRQSLQLAIQYPLAARLLLFFGGQLHAADGQLLAHKAAEVAYVGIHGQA